MNISVGDIVRDSKQIIVENKNFFILFALMYGFASTVPSITEKPNYLLLGLLFLAQPLWIIIGAYCCYELACKKQLHWDDHLKTTLMAKVKDKYLAVFIALICVYIITFVGLLLLIIPGIIVAIRLTFVNYYIIIANSTIKEAMRLSWENTRAYFWLILKLMLVLFVVGFVLGMIVLGMISYYPLDLMLLRLMSISMQSILNGIVYIASLQLFVSLFKRIIDIQQIGVGVSS